MKQSIANYLPSSNELEVIRAGETTKRKIKCTNFNPNEPLANCHKQPTI